MKRSKRRNRWRLKAHLNRLDTIALAQINQSFSSAMNTWGGTRCPGCGIGVRPHWIVPWVWHFVIDDKWGEGEGECRSRWQTFACDRVKCPGECDWQ